MSRCIALISPLVGALLGCLCCAPMNAARAETSPTSTSLLTILSETIFGESETFHVLPDNAGWEGLLLAPPGSAIDALTEAYSGIPGTLAQALANAAVFDRLLGAKNGYVVFSPRPLDSAWGDVLEAARPSVTVPRDRMLQTDIMKWLFRPIYKSGRIVGYTREPSRYVNRYNEFAETYAQLMRGRDNEMWRLDPRLAKYSTFESAQEGVISEWRKSGYKIEVEAATWAFEASVNADRWTKWGRSDQVFDLHRVPINLYDRLPETYLVPPPASWSSVSMWRRTALPAPDGKGEYRFQIARVDVVRPWLDVDSALAAMSMDNETAVISIEARPNVTVSDGTTPSVESLPGGIFSAFVTGIILVRDITTTGSVSDTNYEHPLARFASPDRINILGYVVRVLPKATGQPVN